MAASLLGVHLEVPPPGRRTRLHVPILFYDAYNAHARGACLYMLSNDWRCVLPTPLVSAVADSIVSPTSSRGRRHLDVRAQVSWLCHAQLHNL